MGGATPCRIFEHVYLDKLLALHMGWVLGDPREPEGPPMGVNLRTFPNNNVAVLAHPQPEVFGFKQFQA